MDRIVHDLRYAVRMLVKRPGVSTVAVITLALGIGATTAMFSVVHAVVLRGLPYAEPERLGLVWVDFGEGGQSAPGISSLDYRDLQQRLTLLEGLAAGTGSTGNLTGKGEPEQVDIGYVSFGFFPLLGVEPALGRNFVEEEDVFHGPDVLILSHELWQRRFGGDARIVGSTVQINGTGYEVVGVMPAGFELLLPPEQLFLQDSDVWAPLQDPFRPPRNRTLLTAIGRLRDGVSFKQAQEELSAAVARLREEHEVHRLSDTRMRLTPLQDDVVQHVRPALLALFGAVGLVLLIACGNVANLLLARATARTKEISIRRALGAGRARIVRQLLTEASVLAICGGALGLLLAVWGVGFLVALRPAHLPRLDTIGIDGSVLAFSLGTCFLTVLLFGMAPALQASRHEIVAAMRGALGQVSGRQPLYRAVVVTEVALSLVLLVAVGLLARSLLSLQQVDPGFRAENVLSFQLSLPSARYPSTPERDRFFTDLEDSLRALPGVTAVGAISALPLSGRGGQAPYAYDDETAQNWESVTTDARTVTAGYFETIGARLLQGRWFDEHDDQDSRLVVIVDDKLASKAWPGEDPIGKLLQLPYFGNPGQVTREWHEVVGVVEHARVHELARDGREQVYFPQRQDGRRSLGVLVRAAGDPDALAAMIRREVGRADAELPVHDMRPLDDFVDGALSQPRFVVVLFTAFGGIALLLAMVGLYGVLSYTVGQRTREFGLRLALGAETRGIFRLVLRQALTLILSGTAIGWVAAAGAGQAISSLLFGVSATDPWTFAGISVVLVAVALAACLAPAFRATQVDPLTALRLE